MNKKTFFIILVFALLVCVLVFGIWKFKNGKKQQEQSQIKVQQVNNDDQLQNPESELVWYEIPELGIRFKVEKDMKDELVYQFVGETMATNSNGKPAGKIKSIGFSTKTLINLDSKYCGPINGPIGGLSEYKGKIDQYDWLKNFKGAMRQFENFVITYEGPQASCSADYANDPDREIENEVVLRYTRYFRSEAFLESIVIISN